LDVLLVSEPCRELLLLFLLPVHATFMLGNGSDFKNKGEEKLPVKQRP
jgi:hypothetical protein